MPNTISAPGKDDVCVGVVDDDDVVRHSIRILLELHGLKVVEFNSSVTALAALQRSQCFCLVINMDMPKTDGLQLAEALRAASNQTPVILITAKSRTSELDRIRRSNALALLVKPVQQDELLAWIYHARGMQDE